MGDYLVPNAGAVVHIPPGAPYAYVDLTATALPTPPAVDAEFHGSVRPVNRGLSLARSDRFPEGDEWTGGIPRNAIALAIALVIERCRGVWG